jgi:hypothetical protein
VCELIPPTDTGDDHVDQDKRSLVLLLLVNGVCAGEAAEIAIVKAYSKANEYKKRDMACPATEIAST